jgi:hypothetical protein
MALKVADELSYGRVPHSFAYFANEWVLDLVRTLGGMTLDFLISRRAAQRPRSVWTTRNGGAPLLAVFEKQGNGHRNRWGLVHPSAIPTLPATS